MSAAPFRFLHATNLRLDQPLIGAGTLSADLRATVEDATLTAFSRIVDACLEHEAAFLLLTGDCFEHQSGTLRGRLQMQRGLERLAEHDVEAFIIPGSLDPPSSWKRGISLPLNTTLFTTDEDDPVNVVCDGEVIATIAPVAMATSDESNWRTQGPAIWRSESGTFRIGLVGAGSAVRWNGATPEPTGGPETSSAAVKMVRTAIDQGVNYLALGEGAERQSIDVADGIAHDPGSPQGLNPQESGAKGCSLVEVDEDGIVEIKFVPTAAVRWMSLSADVPSHVDLDQLAERMALSAMECEPYSTDDLWLVRWTVRGAAGEWTKTLSDSRSVSWLWEQVERELASIGGPVRRHTLEGVGRPATVRTVATDPASRDLFDEFCESIDPEAREALEAFRAEINSSEWSQGTWIRHVRSAAQRATPAGVARRTKDLGETWLS